MNPKTFHLISLGCAKNTVDSSAMAQVLEKSGYQLCQSPDKAAFIIVNTCGFIIPAREESLQVLSELARTKKKGQRLIAAGCFTQRYGGEITRQVSGIDAVIGTRRWMDIGDVLHHLEKAPHPVPLYHLPEAETIGRDERGAQLAALQGTSAYLKIADGCRRPCAFCAIPLIKGPLVSRPIETILDEARSLQELGARELNLIAQDTTDYGHDLGMKDGLAVLLERLVTAAPEIDWIRILYAYPGYVSDRLIDVMSSNPQILPYLDMPLQHAHPDTLRRMRRPADIDWVQRTIAKLRTAMPGIALRSTFMVGYPGETEEEFQTLLEFIQEIQFDRLGTFEFSFEPGTSSEPLGDPIPPEIKKIRYDRLMKAQEAISLQKNQALVGSAVDILVEGQGDGISIGRSYRDAPEIDGLVIVSSPLQPGEIVRVKIDGAMVYDLSAVPILADPKAQGGGRSGRARL